MLNSRILGAFRVFNSQNETLFLTLMLYVLCSMDKLLNSSGTLGRLVSLSPKMTLFVQGDKIPNVPDLLIVEYIQQNSNCRVFNSDNNLNFPW